MSLPRCCNFVQCAAHEAAAKHCIDDGNTEGQGLGTGLNPGYPLQSQKTLAKLLDHCKPLKIRWYQTRMTGPRN